MVRVLVSNCVPCQHVPRIQSNEEVLWQAGLNKVSARRCKDTIQIFDVPVIESYRT